MMPAEAVADVLVQDGYRVSLITDIRGDNIKNALVDTDRFVLKTSSYATGGIVGRIKALISVARSTLQMRKLFKKDRPTVVVGFGGYPSLPAVLAARNLGIPFVLHEQNAVLGRVNRFLAEDARVLALSMPDTEKV
ncbi:MAG: glycosyltransferase, partial [Alphaproteobacteria bacterium]|nr:glycosyltransferase [Alphaproteobacteria bacterium]